MTEYKEAQNIAGIVDAAKSIVIVQADNPDADSLGSALALEQILGDLGKETHLYCGVDIPTYLQYLPGWDRVEKDLPSKFDSSIIVDTSSSSLLEQLRKSDQIMWLKSKPCIVIDHHKVESTLDFATIQLNPTAVATGEIIYELATRLSWQINAAARKVLAVAILSDSMGLMTDNTSARTIHIIAELVEKGVDLAALDSARRDTYRRDPELVHYKGRLLQRVEYSDNNRIALVVIPWEEIEKYSPHYNPSMLVIDDMRLAKGTAIAICLKLYKDGKITAKIRCNWGNPIASDLAEKFGGGGHPYAAGFKIVEAKPIEILKRELIEEASSLLDELPQVEDLS